MIKSVKLVKNEEILKDFLNLPRRLYSKKLLHEDASEVKKIILGKHPLSHYFEIKAFVAYNAKKEAVGRFALTKYPDDDNIYLGYCEFVRNNKTANQLFKVITEKARREGAKNIIGPVDASFWIKYRLKINLFDKEQYTGEPYNKEYYLDYYKKNGFEIIDHYTSNIYKAVSIDYTNEKFKEIYNSFIENGYEIKSVKKYKFNKTIKEIYELITTLYSDFPVYKDINKKDFIKIFKSYKLILNFDMVKMAYYNKKPVGFFISIPNYGNLVYNINLIKLFKIFKIKKNPKNYVMLYMGILPEHKGLGSALCNSILEELKEKNIPSIGALAHDGKKTQNYASDCIEDRYEYVLLKKKL